MELKGANLLFYILWQIYGNENSMSHKYNLT